MSSKFKLVSVVLSLVLVLAAFPTIAADASGCNYATFLEDVTVRDGTQFAPGATFTKTWLLRNSGTCAWTGGVYKLVLVPGSNDFGVGTSHPLVDTVLPGGTVKLTIPGMTAPATPGKHRSSWVLDNGAGKQFGVGRGVGVPIFALINVVVPPAVTYDFTTNAPSAIWTSGVPGSLSFPGTPGDPIGSVFSDPAPQFESNVIASTPGLVVSPNNAYNGFIEGYFTDGYTVNKGDRFQTTVGCEYGTFYCYVAFSLKYQIGSGPVYTLWNFREKYEGLTYSANINLDQLAGKTVNFILSMSAHGSPMGDSAIWGRPVIVGTGSAGPISPNTDGWNTYKDPSVPFTLMFPGSTITAGVSQIILPKGTGVDKSLEDIVISTTSTTPPVCLSTIPSPGPPTPYTSPKGVNFNIEESSTGGVWIAYTAIKPASSGPSDCVSLVFKLDASGTPSDWAALKAIADTLQF